MSKPPDNTLLDPRRPRATLPEFVYRKIHDQIVSGALDPSRRLTEMRIAEMLGVSRTPVREALIRLRREGLLDTAPRADGGPRLSRADVEEIMEVRLLIEPHVAMLAAERADPEGLVGLQRALAVERQSARQRTAVFAVANHEFRVVFLRLAGNLRLAESASRYDSQLQTLRLLSLRTRQNRDMVIAGHATLVQDIGRGDGAAASRTMRTLLEVARDRSVALVEKARRGLHEEAA